RSALAFGGQWGALNGTGELSHFQTDGYRDHSAAERDHLNAKLRYSLSEATSMTLVANSLRQPDTQDPLGLTRAQMEQDPRQATPQALAFNTRKTVEQDQAGVTLAHRLGAGSRLELTLYGGQRFVEQFLAIPLVTQSAPTHSGGVVNLDRNYGGAALRYFTDLGPVRLSAGIENEAMEERRRGFENLNGVSGALKRDEDNEVKSLDFFAQGEWKATERLSLHAGARRSRVAFESSDHFIVAGNGDDSGAKTYRATTPVAGVLFRVNRTTSVYGNVGRGFETPTFVELAYRSTGPGLNFDLEPSRSRHAELGIKTLAAGWLRLNAALFEVRTTNEIVVEQNTGGRATFKNAGRTDRAGYEVAAETVLGGPFEARVSYTYLEATFAEDFTTVAGLPAVAVTVPAGNLLPGVPRRQLYAELRYRQPAFFAQVDTLRRSRVAVDDRNTDFADGYQIYGAAAGLVQEGRDWTVTEYIRIDNLTDRNYAGSVIVNDGNGRYYEPSPRRSMAVGLQASLRF
ncbi:MAG TPA: TonB-dependent receptor, partial [Thiobacillaceae bacterium]